MYPVSERYKTAIRARARADRVTGTLTLTDGTVLALGVQDFMSGRSRWITSASPGRNWPSAASTWGRRRSACARV